MASPRDATSMLVTRGSGSTLEILLVERSPALRFFGGYWAFPGGAVDPIDQTFSHDPELTPYRCCAIRELIEETRLVCADFAVNADTAFALTTGLADNADVRASWTQLLQQSRSALAALRRVCRITTPSFAPIRFATDFVHIPVTMAQTPVFDPGEIVSGRFFKPREAIQNWRNGEQLIAPPVLFLLELLAAHGLPGLFTAAAQAAAAFDHGAFHPARFSPGVFMAPVDSPTLLPATTTNCLIIGEGRLYVVDPAAVSTSEQDRLVAKLTELVVAGAALDSILLTHHHRDHVGAVSRLSRHFGIPVRAHALTYPRLPNDDYLMGTPLKEGDRLELGTAPDGTPDWHLEVLHTPGHARDHLCFIESRYRAAIVGDMLSTVSTILIDPPEGHMATYLQSLERLLSVPLTTLYPAHGPAHRDGHGLIRYFLSHRRQREQRIKDSLSNEPASMDALLPKAYGDVSPEVYPVAIRALAAGLEKLSEEGFARETHAGWVLQTHK